MHNQSQNAQPSPSPEKKRRHRRRNIVLGVELVGAVILCVYQFTGGLPLEEPVGGMIDTIITRAVGSIAVAVLLAYLGYRVFSPPARPVGKTLLFLIPGFLIAVNNFPFLSAIRGASTLTAPGWQVALFALQCLLIGFFEETAFRGIFLLRLLEDRRQTRRDIFWCVIVSSVVFGLIHLANLAAGAAIGPTLMQVGYSALVGGLCAVVFLRTQNLLFPILLHAVYDFCGLVLSTLGTRGAWDAPTVVITVLLSLAVAAYMVAALWRLAPQSCAVFFPTKEPPPDEGAEALRGEAGKKRI